MPYPISYHFSQHFAVPAKTAYKWCTDYTPQDHKLIGNIGAKREVIWLSDATVLLKDTFQVSGGCIEKQKQVDLYPDRLSWISTHISGPNKYSLFIYKISDEGEDNSKLDFQAIHVENEGNLSEQAIATLQAELCISDSNIWKRFAAAMEQELKGNQS